MRRVLISFSLLFACAAAAGAMDPVAPVPADEPVPEKARKMFDEAFGADVMAAQATETLADDGDVAKRIYARVLEDADPDVFRAYALDQVVKLAGASPRHQRLVYDALRMQKTLRMRPARGCLDRMAVVGGRIVDVGAAADWVGGVYAVDMIRLAEMMICAGELGPATNLLDRVKGTTAKFEVTLPADHKDAVRGLEFFRNLDEVRKQFDAVIRTPGDHVQARLALAALRLVRDGDQAGARTHLVASGDSLAFELMDALRNYTRTRQSKAACLALAKALDKMAETVRGSYFKALLWKECCDRLDEFLGVAGTADADRAEVQALRTSLSGKLEDVLRQCPPVVRCDLYGFDEDSRLPVRVAQPDRRVAFFGLPLGGAKRIAFVIDRSASMTGSLMRVKEHLTRCIGTLGDDRHVYVVFYSEGPPVEMPSRRMVPATEQNCRAVCEFINGVTPAGGSDPNDALRRAFDQQPDRIVLLSANDLNPGVAGHVRQLNPESKVPVDVIEFMCRDTLVLPQIARANKGRFRHVGFDERGTLRWGSGVGEAGDAQGQADQAPMPFQEREQLGRRLNELEENIYCSFCNGAGRFGTGRCGVCGGTGKTPPGKLRPYIDRVLGLCRQYGADVPQALQKRSRRVLARIDHRFDKMLDEIFKKKK